MGRRRWRGLAMLMLLHGSPARSAQGHKDAATVVGAARCELTTPGSGGRCSIQMSYAPEGAKNPRWRGGGKGERAAGDAIATGASRTAAGRARPGRSAAENGRPALVPCLLYQSLMQSPSLSRGIGLVLALGLLGSLAG